MSLTRKIDANLADLAGNDTAKFRKVVTFKGVAKFLSTEPATSDVDFSELDITLYAKEFKLVGKLVYKLDGSTVVPYGIRLIGITSYTSSEKRLLLQGAEPSSGTYTLDFDKGYLKT